jgi:hypothetical protein
MQTLKELKKRYHAAMKEVEAVQREIVAVTLGEAPPTRMTPRLIRRSKALSPEIREKMSKAAKARWAKARAAKK